jgi:type I restriction enzyme R subunit
MQQALDYAEILDPPFAYSSNGDAFLEHDRTGSSGKVTRELALDRFPTPAELWARYCKSKSYTPDQEAIATQDYYEHGSGKSPRYYQFVAINRTVDAVGRGRSSFISRPCPLQPMGSDRPLDDGVQIAALGGRHRDIDALVGLDEGG